MSKASEWAKSPSEFRPAADRPWAARLDFEEGKLALRFHPELDWMRPDICLHFARWILDTFGEPGEPHP